MAEVLTEFDRNSPLWKKLRSHMEERLARLRMKNDGRLDAESTARVRGAIAELKHLITLDAPPDMRAPDENDLFKD